MLLTIIFGVLTIVCAIVIIYSEHKDFIILGSISGVTGCITLFVTIIMIIISVLTCIGNDAFIESSKQKYISLVYQAENNIYDTAQTIPKKELMDEITKWNEEIAKGKVMQHNPWVNWFYHQGYEQFELIPVSIVK